jgi:uncharacterized protein with HEPN domain
MVARSTHIRLLDMQEAILALQRIYESTQFEDAKASWTICRAVERGLEIISEASRHLPDDMKTSESQIPWRQIADIGNVLRHAYDRVDFRFLWALMEQDLPPLAEAVERLLDQTEL